jgi:glyoxylase-like metal-dependent hydrolase (beta-lactamase superfamily II)
VRAVSLHPDVLLVGSALLQVNCVIVRSGETFVIDSPVLPDELDALPSLIEQAGFPPASGLLATHADWDHLLGRLAFPGCALGCAESSTRRLRDEPGTAQRELRAFDEELAIVRPAPLSLGSVQALPVPGRCEIGESELELHPTVGHTDDGMAILVPWADVLVAGDYLSEVEIPSLGTLEAYEQTLATLEPLLERVEYVVPGHGPAIGAERARQVLAEDRAYLAALRELGADAPLPPGRDTRRQRAVHAENAALVAS